MDKGTLLVKTTVGEILTTNTFDFDGRGYVVVSRNGKYNVRGTIITCKDLETGEMVAFDALTPCSFTI